MLKQKHDTILTNHILRPTIKRFTEGKYYSESSWLGHRVFRVVKITKCFITIHYTRYDFCLHREWVENRMKRRYDKDDYEYFHGYRHHKTKDVVEMDKNPMFGGILWKKFGWRRESFEIYSKYDCERKKNDLMLNIKETNGDFDWLLIDLRKEKIVEYEDKVARAIQDSLFHTAEQYQDYAKELNDVNRIQITLYGKPPPPTQSDIEYILQSETK
tara:strand:- start:1208 stop:1852 length:645 start_codon:yes stop_codon:yes gene_type:complete